MSTPWLPDIAVDLDTARRLLAAAAPELAELPLAVLGEGWDNLVVAVGDDLLLRLPRRELGGRLLLGELDFLAAWGAALPVPIPRLVQRIPPTRDYPFTSALVTAIAGETADRAPPRNRRGIGVALAGMLRALHDLPPTLPGGTPRGDTLRRADLVYRRAWLHERLDELVGDVPGVDPAPVAALIDDLAQTPPAPRLTWVHADLYARHLIVRGEVLAGVIDWGDVHLGDPALDLSIAWSWLPEQDRPAFVAAYGEIDPATWRRARLRAVHYAVNLLRFGHRVGDAAMIRIARDAWRACVG
jgi:aminoglycoside phosphotransferase (APT) family kinase protein